MLKNMTAFYVESIGTYQFQKTTEQSRKRGKPQYPAKVNVWAGVSRRGATKLLIFDGIMRKEFFIEEILKNTFLQFAKVMEGDIIRHIRYEHLMIVPGLL